MKKLVAAGATFIARTHATQVKHMVETFERAMDHDGFSVVEVLSECVEFYPGAFDGANPRKGGAFSLIEEKKWDHTPEDEKRHDTTDEPAAFALAQIPFPGLVRSFPRSGSPDEERARAKLDPALARKSATPAIARSCKRPLIG